MKYLTLLIILIAFSCGGKKQTEKVVNGVISLDSLKAEVIAIHDEVMPKMGELRRTRKDLMLKADSLSKTDSVRASVLSDLANDIADASEGMMVWMRAYEPEFEGTEAEIRAYFEAEKKAIQKVNKDMKDALNQGLEALGSDQ